MLDDQDGNEQKASRFSRVKCLFNAKTGAIEVIIEDEMYKVLKYANSLQADIFSCSSHLHLIIRYESVSLVLGLCKICASVLDPMTSVPLVISNTQTDETRTVSLFLRK